MLFQDRCIYQFHFCTSRVVHFLGFREKHHASSLGSESWATILQVCPLERCPRYVVSGSNISNQCMYAYKCSSTKHFGNVLGLCSYNRDKGAMSALNIPAGFDALAIISGLIDQLVSGNLCRYSHMVAFCLGVCRKSHDQTIFLQQHACSPEEGPESYEVAKGTTGAEF